MSVGFLIHGFGSDASASVASAPSYDTDAAAHFARMTASDATLLSDLDDLFVGLKADGLFTKLECLYVVKTLESDTLLNLISSSYDVTKTGTISFVADSGVDVDQDITSYLEVPYNPPDDGGIVGQDDITVFQWTNNGSNDNPSNLSYCDFTDYLFSQNLDVSSTNYFRTYPQAVSIAVQAANSTVHKFTAYTRYDASNVRIAVDTTVTGFAQARTYSFYNRSISSFYGKTGHYLFGYGKAGSSFGNMRFAAFGIGNGMNATQLNNLKTRLDTYLTARGAI